MSSQLSSEIKRCVKCVPVSYATERHDLIKVDTLDMVDEQQWSSYHHLFNVSNELQQLPVSASLPSIPLMPTFKARMGGQTIRVLLDSGATSNFVSKSFVVNNQLKTTSKPSYTLAMADGSQAACTQVLQKATLKLNKLKVKLNLDVVDIKRYDVILGIPWLHAFNPEINWTAGRLKVTWQNQQYEIYFDHAKKQGSSSKVSAKAIRKHITRGQQCYAVTISPVDQQMSAIMESVTDDETTHVDHTNKQQIQPNASKLKQLLEEYQDVFPEQLYGLPPKRDVEHHIVLKDGSHPVARAPYRLSVAEENELKSRLQELIEAGHIQPSSSPWAAPILFVPKKDGGLRFCVDYRGLNNVTIRDQHALPIPEDQIRRLSGATVFSKIDLRSGYYQVRVAEEDIPKTAFTTTYGLYEFRVMPFGLSNAPATFSRLMMQVLKPYIHKFVLVYIDDILIYSQTVDEHMEHLRLILDCLRQHKLYAKASKCAFLQKQVDFLGYVVSAEGVAMATDKVQAITTWPTPATVGHVRSFLGLTGFYRHFIRRYAHISAPLTDLTKKRQQFVWTQRQQEAFEELKQTIAAAPILRIYDPAKQCIVATDASDYAIGAVLMQEFEDGLHPVAFLSNKLNATTANYDTRQREFLAIKTVACKWRHYLHNGHQPIILTDHESLAYLNSTTQLDAKFARWFSKITAWIGVPKIQYKPGKLNIIADALSRRPDHLLYALSVVMPSIEVDGIKEGLRQDSYVETINKSIEEGTSNYYYSQDGLLYFTHKHGARLYVPDVASIREKLISDHHDSRIAGHFGRNKTLSALQRNFYWPDMKRLVTDYISSCPICQKVKSSQQAPAGLLQPLPIPQRNWESTSMDFIVQLPPTPRGFDAIMVVVDRLSKFVHFIPTHTTATASQAAELFFQHIVCAHGIPSDIVSDRDPKFTASFWQELWKCVGTKLNLSTAYHPQSDGQTERINRILEDMLRAYCLLQPQDWDLYLNSTAFAYNQSTQASTGYSPFFLNYGFHPTTPASLLNSETANTTDAQQFLQRQAAIITQAHANLTTAQQRYKQQADTKRREVTFQPGELVLLSSQHVPLDGDNPTKLRPKFVGPFEVVKRVGPVAYTLDMPHFFKGHPTFHVSYLKKWKPMDKQFPLRLESGEPPPLFYKDGQPYYSVEKILAKRKRRGSKEYEYRIKWQNSKTLTWEPASHLSNADIAEFEASTRKPTKRATRRSKS